MGLNQVKILHSKGNIGYIRRGVLSAINLMGFISRIYKELKKLNTYTQEHQIIQLISG